MRDVSMPTSGGSIPSDWLDYSSCVDVLHDNGICPEHIDALEVYAGCGGWTKACGLKVGPLIDNEYGKGRWDLLSAKWRRLLWAFAQRQKSASSNAYPGKQRTDMLRSCGSRGTVAKDSSMFRCFPMRNQALQAKACAWRTCCVCIKAWSKYQATYLQCGLKPLELALIVSVGHVMAW